MDNQIRQAFRLTLRSLRAGWLTSTEARLSAVAALTAVYRKPDNPRDRHQAAEALLRPELAEHVPAALLAEATAFMASYLPQPIQRAGRRAGSRAE